jgi:polar amino acid transport system substrate-binding protein
MSKQFLPSAQAQKALAPTGKLRVGLNIGSPTHAIRDAASGEMKGVGFDLGSEFARRLGVPVETAMFTSIGQLLDAGRSAAWDIAFIGIDAQRAEYLDYTSPHLELEVGYFLPAGSAIDGFSGVDQPDIRVAVPQNGHADIILSRALKSAKLIRGSGVAGAFDLLNSGKADVLSANKANLFELAQKNPGSEVLDGRIGTEQLAMALPKGRDAGLAYARAFIEEAKADGLIKAAVQKVGLRGAL